MQYRSGDNPHEPTSNQTSSRVWKFFIRHASYRRLPEAFVPHVSLCAWISSPQGRTSSWLLRGVIQFSSTRDYLTMKRRYSKQAEWIPINVSDQYQIQEYTINPIPVNSRRHVFNNPTPISLPRIGLNAICNDLVEDFHTVLYNEEQVANIDLELEASEERRRKRKREAIEEYEAKLAAEALAESGPKEFFETDYFGVRHYTGGRTANGRYYVLENKGYQFFD